MTTIRMIEEYCRQIAPYDLADEWDNVGLLVGGGDAAVRRVLLALDITPAVIGEARELGAQLIISHHPVIFEPLKALEPDTAPYLLAQYDTAALCLHTNLDRAEDGVNATLGEALGLKNTVLYPEDYLLVGEPAAAVTADGYAAYIKERLGAPSVRYTAGRVSRVAVSSGGGGEGIERAEQYGFDAFVTGELKHHQYLYAADHGIAAFDAGHFCTEDVVIRPLCEKLTAQFPDVEFRVSERCACPYRSV